MEKQDANLVGFYKIRETTLGQVPATGDWQTREPNSFDDFGAEYTMVARRPFSPSRQRKKGSTTDLDATGGYNEDVTQNNMQTELEEFFFANMRKAPNIAPVVDGFTKTFVVNAATDVATIAAHGLATGDGPFYVASATTLPVPLAAAAPYWVNVTGANTFKFATTKANAIANTTIDLTDTGTGIHTMTRASVVAAGDDSYLVNEVPAGFVAGGLVLASGYAVEANNGIKTIASVTASKVVVAEALVDEAAPPAGAKLELVGQRFAVGDLELTVGAGNFAIVATAGDFDLYNLAAGGWLFVGGDAANETFANGADTQYGYARIANDGISVDGKTVTFDKSTFTPVATDGAGRTVVIYFSDVLKNEEDPDLITRFSSSFERTLGRDDDGIQTEYTTGNVASEMTWNSPLANLVNIDMAYIAQRADTRTGLLGPLSRRADNNILPAFNENAFNTSSNIYRLRMSMVDPTTLNPTPLFARVTEWTVTVNNNVTSSKAQGVLGGFDTTVGNFDVDGKFTAYFSMVEAIHAVKCNYDVTFDAIYAKANAGVYMDIPLIGLGGGLLDIEQDAAIMIPLAAAAAESPFGHTALVGWFNYLPNLAMPDIDC